MNTVSIFHAMMTQAIKQQLPFNLKDCAIDIVESHIRNALEIRVRLPNDKVAYTQVAYSVVAARSQIEMINIATDLCNGIKKEAKQQLIKDLIKE